MKNIKKVFVLCLSVSFLFLLCLYSSAASFTAYGSVTPSTSQINNLINLMINQYDLDLFSDWIGIRTDQYDYSVFYNIKDGKATRLRYYGVQNGYNIDYYYTKSEENNFTYNRGNFSIVGNISNSLSSNDFNNYFNQEILKITVPFILIVNIFFVFRIRKRSKGVTI